MWNRHKPTDQERAQLEKDRIRGERAKQLLNDELIKEAFATIEASILQKWTLSEVDDQSGQYRLRLMHHAASEFKRFFEIVLQNGATAAYYLDEEQAKKRGKRG